MFETGSSNATITVPTAQTSSIEEISQNSDFERKMWQFFQAKHEWNLVSFNLSM